MKVSSNNDVMARASLSLNRRVSFAADNVAPSPHPKSGILKERYETEKIAQAEEQRNEQNEKCFSCFFF